MPSNRLLVFQNAFFYHIFNRGVERRTIFTSPQEYARFIMLLRYYRYKEPQIRYSFFQHMPPDDRESILTSQEKMPPDVRVLAYCLMPNHFHVLVEQESEGGVTKMMSNVSNGYARYFNTKYDRVGPLFQGPFKAVRVETDEHLLHVQRYIHLNPVVSAIVSRTQLASYPWSSLPTYLGISNQPWIDMTYVQSHFKNTESYKTFVFEQIDFAIAQDSLRHLTLE